MTDLSKFEYLKNVEAEVPYALFIEWVKFAPKILKRVATLERKLEKIRDKTLDPRNNLEANICLIAVEALDEDWTK